MAKVNILKDLEDPFGSKYLRKLDNIELSELTLLNKKRADLVIEEDTGLEAGFYFNRIIDDLYLTKYLYPTNKADVIEAEIASGNK
jgi:hypothetical protein